MRCVWVLLIYIWLNTPFQAVFSTCTTYKEYVTTTVSPYGRNYYRNYEERDYYENIICTEIYIIPPKSIECADSKCKSLYFERSNVTSVPTNAFMEALGLRIIKMTNSGIRTIETGAFLGLLKVEEIHLDINNISKISRGSFNSLINLKTLNLSRNSIREIETDSFHGSSSITHLDLSYNKLTSIPRDLLKPLTQLQSLNISNNYLSSVKSNLCYDLVQLRDLILSNNKITEFDGCIEKLMIRRLSLSNNLLSEISNITFSNSLEVLRLDNNNISELSENVFDNLNHLQIIDLANNSISNQTSRLFRNVKRLKVLNISYNEIDSFDPDAFSSIQNLECLIIKGNSISNLQRGVFQNLTSIETFDISENNINYIPVNVLNDLRNLKILNISGNKIEYLESGVFNELNELKILDLSNNSLRDLKPHIFIPLTKLENLSMAYNYLKSFEVEDIIFHCPRMKSLDIDGNKFTCTELAAIVLSSKSKNYTIKKGSTTMSENVNGIACNENENSWYKQNNSGIDNMSKFFDEDFKKSSFYEVFHNFSLYRQNTEGMTNFLAKTELEEIRNVTKSFINELSKLVSTMKKNENLVDVDDNYTLQISGINDLLKNETIQFHEIVRILSAINNELKTEYTNTIFNISKLIKLNNNSWTDIPHGIEQYFNTKNSSLIQLLLNLNSIGGKLEEQLRRNTAKYSNFTSVLEKEIKLFRKFENSTFRNSNYELTKREKQGNDSESSEAMSLKHSNGDLSETKLVTSEIDNLISALDQLKLFIILSMLLFMAFLSVNIYKRVKTDYYDRRNRECSGLDLPILDK